MNLFKSPEFRRSSLGNLRGKYILITVLLIFLIVGGVLGYYYWSMLKQAAIDIKETNISAGVVPHHLLAEEIIEDFFGYISSNAEPETIILLSPDHFNAGDIVGNLFITIESETQEFYEIKVDNPLIKNLSSKNNFTPHRNKVSGAGLVFSNSSVSLDHGITNLAPFVKKYFPDSKIVPFIIPFNISLEETERFAAALNSLASLNTIVIASVDFSHYLPPSAAEFHDLKSIRTLINFEKADFKHLEVDSWQALYIARAFAHLRGQEFPKIIGHSNSINFLENQNTDETTSYFSVVFEKGSQKEVKKFNGKFTPHRDEVSGAGTVLFVGDIMLDRGVEYLMSKNSVFYPFEKVSQFLRGVDTVVGNLEGPIVENPPNFPDSSLKFAFWPNVTKGLSFANFNLLSLANNHTCNTGETGLEETKGFLKKENINFVGHPIRCDKDFLFEKNEIIFLAFNKTFPFNCSDQEIIEIVKKTRNANPKEFLIVIFHWGEEYQLKSSISQQRLAHQIIDAGADLIIGSHPHVVQEIEEYKGKLIFYSLGNFIFDMYFSKETQQGLAVGLEISPQKIIYRLFPIESYLSQPFLMKQEEAEEFLRKLSLRSRPCLLNQIKNSIIEIER